MDPGHTTPTAPARARTPRRRLIPLLVFQAHTRPSPSPPQAGPAPMHRLWAAAGAAVRQADTSRTRTSCSSRQSTSRACPSSSSRRARPNLRQASAQPSFAAETAAHGKTHHSSSGTRVSLPHVLLKSRFVADANRRMVPTVRGRCVKRRERADTERGIWKVPDLLQVQSRQGPPEREGQPA